MRGGDMEVREGTWPGRTVVIEFSDLAAARAWYNSAEYQEILPFRLASSRGEAILVDGFEAAEAQHAAAEPAAPTRRF